VKVQKVSHIFGQFRKKTRPSGGDEGRGVRNLANDTRRRGGGEGEKEKNDIENVQRGGPKKNR